MTLLFPSAMLLLVPLTLVSVWTMHPNRSAATRLPGNWDQVTSPALRHFLRHLQADDNDKSNLLAAICAVLIIATLAHPIVALDSAPPENFRARVIVLDMSAQTDVQAQQFVVDALLLEQASPADNESTATGLVLVSDGAYSVVPVTSDLAHLTRYQSVASPALMPQDGRALHEGISLAETMLANAGVAVGQVIVVTSHNPITDLIAIPQHNRLRDIIVTSSDTDNWSAVADFYNAKVYAADQLTQVQKRLSAEANHKFLRGVKGASFDLRPPLIVVALVVWLWLLRRRTDR